MCFNMTVHVARSTPITHMRNPSAGGTPPRLLSCTPKLIGPSSSRCMDAQPALECPVTTSMQSACTRAYAGYFKRVCSSNTNVHRQSVGAGKR